MFMETVRQLLPAESPTHTRSTTRSMTAPPPWWGFVGRKSVAGALTAGLVVALGLGAATPSFAALPTGDLSTVGMLGSGLERHGYRFRLMIMSVPVLTWVPVTSP